MRTVHAWGKARGHRPRLQFVASIPFLIAAITLAAVQAVPQQSQSGVIRVLVRAEGTSEALAGAQVTLIGTISAAPSPPQPPPPPPTAPSSTSSTTVRGGVIGGILNTTSISAATSRNAVTDANGVAVFDNLPPGRYTISARRDGYVGVRPASVVALATPLAPTNTTSSVILNPAQLVQETTLFLARGASISGRVRDAYGVPLPNASVAVGVLGYRDGQRTLLRGATVAAGPQGDYSLSSIGPGDYYIRLESVALLRGVGTYYPGVMDIDKATLISIRSGEEVVGIDFDTAKTPLFKISGAVLNAPARTLPNGQSDTSIPSFSFVPADPDNPEGTNAPLIPNAIRDSTGKFEITGIPPGVWDIFPVISLMTGIQPTGIQPTLPANAPRYATGRARVVITDRDVSGVTIVVSSSDIKGRITLTSPLPERLPPALSMPRISLIPRENIPSPLISQARIAQTTDANGAFSFVGVPPGKYALQVTPLPPTFFVASVRIGSKIIEDGVIRVGSDPIEPVEITLANGGGAVSGRVSGVSNTANPARAVLIPDGARRDNGMFYRNVVLQAGGTFWFPNVSPGSYKLFAWENAPTGAEQNAAFLAKYEGFGAPVTIAAGDDIFDVEVPLMSADK